jgi:hypothetical protein
LIDAYDLAKDFENMDEAKQKEFVQKNKYIPVFRIDAKFTDLETSLDK